MLFLDGVWVKAPTREELTQLTRTLASRIGRFLERQGLLDRDADDPSRDWD
jgi:hypothetical protein